MSLNTCNPLDERHQSSLEDNSTSYSSDENEQSWISWFCALKGNEFFCEVDEEYIQDDFNLSGLSSVIPYYDYALDMILDIESPNGSKLTEQQHELVESAAELLYGLIHARYILSSRGMISMLEKFKQSHFGRCPRIACNNQSCLPVGTSDIFRTATLKIFSQVDCFNLCDVLRLHLSTYSDSLIAHVMHDGSGDLFGCICSN